MGSRKNSNNGSVTFRSAHSEKRMELEMSFITICGASTIWLCDTRRYKLVQPSAKSIKQCDFGGSRISFQCPQMLASALELKRMTVCLLEAYTVVTRVT